MFLFISHRKTTLLVPSYKYLVPRTPSPLRQAQCNTCPLPAGEGEVIPTISRHNRGEGEGNIVTETRYREASLWDKPWGEVRYTTNNSTLPTRYTYTGQYSYIIPFRGHGQLRHRPGRRRLRSHVL